jgi:hypothetical protein
VIQKLRSYQSIARYGDRHLYLLGDSFKASGGIDRIAKGG